MNSEQEAELIEGVLVLGRKLRQWREYAKLASITGRWETADRTMVEITCDDADHIWIVDPPGADPLDVTTLMEEAA